MVLIFGIQLSVTSSFLRLTPLPPSRRPRCPIVECIPKCRWLMKFLFLVWSLTIKVGEACMIHQVQPPREHHQLVDYVEMVATTSKYSFTKIPNRMHDDYTWHASSVDPCSYSYLPRCNFLTWFWRLKGNEQGKAVRIENKDQMESGSSAPY
ncbi:uncharacterized protein B0T23DRAFT_147494 [Neurospora hispaniola]|uniref:Uncharacterized protein n=1 Tax=Neurospora hispaniola TaxID=588809 RepID=A0AAJ0I825_9PEZI|nr:hypothetical protein B0T23DRAFT_147494 [Neurospora hispaniola]